MIVCASLALYTSHIASVSTTLIDSANTARAKRKEVVQIQRLYETRTANIKRQMCLREFT